MGVCGSVCEQFDFRNVGADKRSEFQRLLETVRHLKELGIEVRFEKENISLLSENGEKTVTRLIQYSGLKSV